MTNIRRLYDAGARAFLVANAMNMSTWVAATGEDEAGIGRMRRPGVGSQFAALGEAPQVRGVASAVAGDIYDRLPLVSP
jgi:hypothetical protein